MRSERPTLSNLFSQFSRRQVSQTGYRSFAYSAFKAPFQETLGKYLGAAVVALAFAASGTRARIRVPTSSWESMLKVPFTWEIRSAMLTSPSPPLFLSSLTSLRRQTSETTNSLSVSSESVPSLGFLLVVVRWVLETFGFEGESQPIS